MFSYDEYDCDASIRDACTNASGFFFTVWAAMDQGPRAGNKYYRYVGLQAIKINPHIQKKRFANINTQQRNYYRALYAALLVTATES